MSKNLPEENQELTSPDKDPKSGLWKFLIPSIFGVLVFLFPIYDGETFNIPLGVITEFIEDVLSGALPIILVIIMMISTVATFAALLFKPQAIVSSNLWNSLFNVSWFWAITRLVGTILVIMTYYGIGSEVITSEDTGQNMLGLLSTLIVWFLVASFLMPYLINFGAMEFVGTLVRQITRPLFTLPGRSTIDLLASWVGNVNVGVVITREQYNDGFYTAREAATIATSFSAVSLPFCLVVARAIGVDHLFPVLYLTIVIAGIVSAVITPRIPPLSRIPDTYYKKSGFSDVVPTGVSKFKWAMDQAIKRAKKAGSFKDQIKQGNEIFMGIVFVLMPQVMAIGTVALIIAQFTPIFDFIAKPMVPLLNLLQIPEATAAAPSTLIGFVDMFIPAILGADIESEMTRFVIAALSLSQIIYLTEMGTLIIISKIPVHVGHLFVIFLERTLISLPIVALMAHIIF